MKNSGITIRDFSMSDADAVSAMIGRTLRISNSRDYPAEEIARLVGVYSAGNIISRAENMLLKVAAVDGAISGCGGISFREESGEGLVSALFVDPEYQGRGIGRSIMEALEAEALLRGCRKIVLDASITALRFYLRLGFAEEGSGEEENCTEKSGKSPEKCVEKSGKSPEKCVEKSGKSPETKHGNGLYRLVKFL
ncbi:MAG: GNAT family N-acetyltransferase [Clostridia bacterium]|nr:GNAT family N-acetyltransferase [Clostridia bacterium]